MLTSRTLLAAAVLAVVSGGCAAVSEPVDTRTSALGESPTAAGIREGSAEEEGVLLLVNDRSATAEILAARAKIAADTAATIVGFRTGPDGKPRWFKSVDEVDALPGTDAALFKALVADARAVGLVEAADFAPVTARLTVPDNLGRPPTSNDVTVEAGLDGLSPDAVAKVVRSRITHTVHSSNEHFVADTARMSHKAFTIAVGNLFATNSPHATFVQGLGADSVTMLGTASIVMPTILVATKGGQTTYYARNEQTGRYGPVPVPKYPVLMRARVRLVPAGVRVFYPAWSASVLTGPTTVITEGNP